LPSQVEIEGLQRCGDQFAMVADQGLRCPPSGPVYAPTEEIRIETAMLSISNIRAISRMLLPCRLKTRISTASSATNMRSSAMEYPTSGIVW
jgi:hypothetical protein